MTLDVETQEMVAANEADWDARAPLHAASQFYSQPAEYWFADYEWDDLGPLRRARRTASAVPPRHRDHRVRPAWCADHRVSISRRSRWRRRAGSRPTLMLDIEYVHANVYDAVDALQGRQFDVVYTGKGALCYLPDLQHWAEGRPRAAETRRRAVRRRVPPAAERAPRGVAAR